MTLRKRLSLTIAGIALLLVLPSAYGISQLSRLRDLARTQRVGHAAAFIALGQLQSSLGELHRLQSTYVGDPMPSKRRDMLAELNAARLSVSQLADAGYEDAAAVARARLAGLGVATRRIELLVSMDRMDEATDYLDTVTPLLEDADSTIAFIGNEIDRRSEADLAAASTVSTTAVTTALGALLVCALLAVLLGFWTTRALTHPIMRLRDAVAVVAGGDFAVPETLPDSRRDEIGSLSRSFQAMTRRLAELDRLKAEFLSFATHELRTPLNVVGGYAELMDEGIYGELSAAQHEAVAAIREQTNVIARLVSQLLDIGRLEAGGLHVEIRQVSAADFFARIERAFAPLAQRRDIQFAVDTDASVPATLQVDAERLADQVIGNLLSNALKFTPEGGRIQFRARGRDRSLVLEVSDTGPGIPADRLPHIFDRYYQVGSDARGKGAGIGLSIAADVVRAHGGTIEAASEPGRGSLFRVTLPAGAGPGLDGPGAGVGRER
jgi:signal transduction histidine kinase